METKIAKFISIITVAPLVSIVVLSWMWLSDRAYFSNSLNWLGVSILLLTVVPVSAYLLKFAIPSIRIQGRDGERKLAFIMAVTGYIAGVMVCQVFHGPKAVFILFLAYFTSGFILLLINRYIKIKASGHACGFAGPITFLIYLLGGKSWFIVLLLPLVFWSRLKLGRHNMTELLLGSLTGIIPAIVMLYFFAV